jgi:hypothetical protein
MFSRIPIAVITYTEAVLCHQRAKNILKNSTVAVVIGFSRRIDTNDGVEDDFALTNRRVLRRPSSYR